MHLGQYCKLLYLNCASLLVFISLNKIILQSYIQDVYPPMDARLCNIKTKTTSYN